MKIRIMPLALLSANVLLAQQSSNPVSQFTRDVLGDQKRIWTSPLHIDQRQFWTIAVPLVGGTVALKSLDTRITRELPNTQDQFTWSDHISAIGSAYTLTSATVAPLLIGHYADKPAVKEIGRNGLEALVNSAIVGYALKYTFWRERPGKPGSNGSFWSGGNSFPSGHAISTFAIAAAVAHHPRCPKWLGITAYTAATAVSLSRVSGNHHWTSDIYFGGFAGVLIGNSVANAARTR